jgi:hypothetical protein
LLTLVLAGPLPGIQVVVGLDEFVFDRLKIGELLIDEQLEVELRHDLLVLDSFAVVVELVLDVLVQSINLVTSNWDFETYQPVVDRKYFGHRHDTDY